MDYYWVNVCCKDKPLRYSDFNIGDELRTNADALKERKDWLGTEKERLNKMIAEDCDGIVTGLYEYWTCYQPSFPQKLHLSPFLSILIHNIPTFLMTFLKDKTIHRYQQKQKRI